MNPFRTPSTPPLLSKSLHNIPNWLIYSLILTAIIISVVFYLIPFQDESSKDGKIAKVYFADNITKAHLEIINAFNKKYYGKIEVIPIDLPTLKFTTNKKKELITRTLRSRNSRIDIFAVDQIWVPRFAKWAEPLDSYFSKKEQDKILPQALNTSVINDTLFAVPFYIDVGVLYYRKDLIEKLRNTDSIKTKLKNGITWNELISFKNNFLRNKYLYVYQGDAYEGLICNFLEILGDNSNTIYKNGKFNVYNSYTVDAVQKLVDLIYKYKITPESVYNFDEDQSFNYALKNDIPFFRGWPTTVKYSNLVSRTTGKLNLLDQAPLPRNPNGNSSSTIGGWNFVLSRYSGVKKEAMTFIKFVLSEECQELNYRSGSYLPILKSFYYDENILNKYPQIKEFKNILANAKHRPSDYNYTKISDILSLYINKALRREMSAETALKTAQNQIDAALKTTYINK